MHSSSIQQVKFWAQEFATNHYLYSLETPAGEKLDPEEAIKRLTDFDHYDIADIPVIADTYSEHDEGWVAERIGEMITSLIASAVPSDHSPIRPLLRESFLLDCLRHDKDGNQRPLIYWQPGDLSSLRPELSDQEQAVVLDGITKIMNERSVELGWTVMEDALEFYEADLKNESIG